jgi:hypothetical protein
MEELVQSTGQAIVALFGLEHSTWGGRINVAGCLVAAAGYVFAFPLMATGAQLIVAVVAKWLGDPNARDRLPDVRTTLKKRLKVASVWFAILIACVLLMHYVYEPPRFLPLDG